jgi:hypothetical protein
LRIGAAGTCGADVSSETIGRPVGVLVTSGASGASSGAGGGGDELRAQAAKHRTTGTIDWMRTRADFAGCVPVQFEELALRSAQLLRRIRRSRSGFAIACLARAMHHLAT